jgi:hypothetical protein
MARSIGCLGISCSLWLVLAGTAAGQAVVEAGLGAAGAATTTAAPARGIAKSIGGMAGSLDKLIKAQPESDTQTPATPTALAHAAPPASVKWEDPTGIETGITYEELVRRFGPPTMEITGETGKSVTYAGKGGTVRLDVQDGKVTAVRKPKS